MTSSQCFLPPKVGVEGEMIFKKSLSPKNFDQATAFLLTACCSTLPNVQSSHDLNMPVTWIPMALAAAWLIDLDGWPSSTWRSLIFFLWGAVADCTLSLPVSQRNSTLATQLSWVLIWQSRMISPSVDLTMMLFWLSLEIFFLFESLHVRKNRFTPALGQNFMGHRVCTFSVPSTCQTLM